MRRGEIVGLYGLLGSGTFEFAETCYGIRPAQAGDLSVDGRTVRIGSPKQAKAAGICMVPADRSRQALFGFQSILFNISIRELQRVSRFGFLRLREELAKAKELIGALRIKTPTPYQPVSAMSGGNAQKVVMARQLVGEPDLLILAEPTQGVDVGAKEEVHGLIERMADGGAGVLVVSTDLSEILRICDRIVVFRDGRIAQEFEQGCSQAQLLAAAAGVTHDEEAEPR